MTLCEVVLWGLRVGSVSAEPAQTAAFEWNREFAQDAAGSGVEPAPLMMPVAAGRIYRFPELAHEAFRGLPGMLADALPDRWGNELISAWLASQGRSEASFDAAERLSYIGNRGMGALEFRPSTGPVAPSSGTSIDVTALTELASSAVANREGFVALLKEHPEREQVEQILQIGTSAGGARPKALIAYNELTGEVRSGQLNAPKEFSHWLLKFDGTGGGDHGLADPQGWGQVEYAYYLMALEAGIEISESRLLDEGPRRHFMTRRFDRTDTGGKLHVQTVAALAHINYNVPRLFTYEQTMQLVRRLTGDDSQVRQMVLRMAFNVLSRNQDDHVKNTAFVMDQGGTWRLSPAYDLTLAYEPGNTWLDAHQMTVNGKGKGVTDEDLIAAAATAGVKPAAAKDAVEAARAAVGQWPQFAEQAGIAEERSAEIQQLQRAAAG